MIRYSFALSTRQFAATLSDSGRSFAAERGQKRGCGFFKQTAFWHNQAPNLDGRDRSSFDHRLVLVSMRVSALLSMGLPIYPAIRLFVVQQLGQQLAERDGWSQSGRYGCNPVPRQD